MNNGNITKNILGNENKRTFGNKIKELFYALSLELHTNKEDILVMYANKHGYLDKIDIKDVKRFEDELILFFNKKENKKLVEEKLRKGQKLTINRKQPTKKSNILFG